MSVQVDKFCDGLRDKLNSVEARLQMAKANVQTLAGQAQKGMREKFEDFHRKAKGQKDRMEQVLAKLKTSTQQKVAETKEAVNEWKAKHEMRKLSARAERAETYALDAIDHAVFAIEHAEEAIAEALVARMDAEETQSKSVV